MFTGYKHYIRLNKDNTIVLVFHSWQFDPIEGDVLWKEDRERHTSINIRHESGAFNKKWDGKAIVDKPVKELLLDPIYYAWNLNRNPIYQQLSATDSKMLRSLEDTLDILISNDILTIKSLSPILADTYLLKKELRLKLSSSIISIGSVDNG